MLKFIILLFLYMCARLTQQMRDKITVMEGTEMRYNAPFETIERIVSTKYPNINKFPQSVQDGVISYRYNTSDKTVTSWYYGLLDNVLQASDQKSFQEASDKLLRATRAPRDKEVGMPGLRKRRELERSLIAKGLGEMAKQKGFNFTYVDSYPYTEGKNNFLGGGLKPTGSKVVNNVVSNMDVDEEFDDYQPPRETVQDQVTRQLQSIMGKSVKSGNQDRAINFLGKSYIDSDIDGIKSSNDLDDIDIQQSGDIPGYWAYYRN